VANPSINVKSEQRKKLPSELIEKFGVAQNGKPYFMEFRKDMHRNFEEVINPT